MTSETYREIDGEPIFWDDGKIIHSVEGGWGPQDQFRLLWTDCEKDVPANAAYVGEGNVTCPSCLSNVSDCKTCKGAGYIPQYVKFSKPPRVAQNKICHDCKGIGVSNHVRK